jgi:hypothetical protein
MSHLVRWCLAVGFLLVLAATGSTLAADNPLTVLDSNIEALTPQEVGALWTLVKEGKPDQVVTWVRQKSAREELDALAVPRSALILHAVVGLDLKRRDDLLRALLAPIADDNLELFERVTLALVVLDLGEPSPATARLLAPILTRGFVQTSPSYHSDDLATALSRVAQVLPERESRAICRASTETLLDQLIRRKSIQYDSKRISALLGFTARLEAAEATKFRQRAARAVLATAEVIKAEGYAAQVLGQVLPLLEAMPHAEARPLARQAAWAFVGRLEAETNPGEIVDNAHDLAQCVRWLPEDEVARIGDRACPCVLWALANIRQHLGDRDDPEGGRRLFLLSALCKPLPEVSRGWDRAEVRHLYDTAVTQLLDSILETQGRIPPDGTRDSLVVLTRLLESQPPDGGALHRTVLLRLERAFNASADSIRLAVLAECLAGVVAVRPTPEGVRICQAAARDVGQRLFALTTLQGLELPPFAFPYAAFQDRYPPQKLAEMSAALASGFATVAGYLPAEEVADLLLTRFPQDTYASSAITELLATELVGALERLDPAAAAPRKAKATEIFLRLLNQESNGLRYSREFLELFVRVADPVTIERMAVRLATVLRASSRMARGRQGDRVVQVVAVGGGIEILPVLRRYLPADRANQVTADLARELAWNLRNTATWPWRPDDLADLAPLLPRELATELCTDVAGTLFNRVPPPGTNREAPPFLLDRSEHPLQVLARLLEFLPRKQAESLHLQMISRALELARAPRSPIDETPRVALLPLLYPVDRDQRGLAIAATVGQLLPSGERCLLAPALLSTAARPLPEPPSPQVLVEALKHPLCVGAEQRTVLDVMGLRYGRTFADQWDFVTFATERKLGLDLRSPPQRKGE